MVNNTAQRSTRIRNEPFKVYRDRLWDIVATSALILILMAAIISGFEYPAQARRLPLIIAVPTLALCLVVLFRLVFLREGGSSDDVAGQEETSRGSQRAFWLTVVAFPVLYLLFGFPLGAGAYMLLVLLCTKTCGPVKALLITLFTVAPPYLIFGYWLHVPIYPGFFFV